MQLDLAPTTRRSTSAIGSRIALAIGFVAFVAQTSLAASPTDKPKVLISGVYLHGFIKGVPDLDSAVRLVNLDDKNAADISGYVLTDKFTPRKQRKNKVDESQYERDTSEPDDPSAPAKRGRPKQDRSLSFPKGATIPAGGEIWVATTAKGFRQTFGVSPSFEGSDTDPGVADLGPPVGFLWLNEGFGTVALLDRSDRVADFVAFQGPKQDGFPEGSLDDVPWDGRPVDLKADTNYGWTGRVLGRARDEQGRVLADTDRAADWPVGFSRMALGVMPTHRVEFAGQTRFVSRPMTVKAKVLATSAPDNNYAALIAAFGTAKKELRVRVYEFTNPKIAEALIKTKQRGVKVFLFLEGSPVAGINDQERYLIERMSKAGIPVHFIGTPKGAKFKPRYVFDHSKYALVDDRLAIIGTENYGRSGVPSIPTYGNRGWMVHIENAEFVRQLREVWDADYQPGVMQDIISIDASPNDKYGMPYRDPNFVPSESIPQGLYHTPAKPAAVDDMVGLELVLSPDTSLNENSAIIGLIKRAKTTLHIEQNSVLPFWDSKQRKNRVDDKGYDPSDPPKDEDGKDIDPGRVRQPNLPLQAVIDAARRGVKVRVLLDGTWYNAEESDDRDNDNTCRLLNDIALKEGLDMSAKVINLESSHLEKIHAKGVIVDEAEVFVGSINWSENSFEGNREVGVVVSHPKIAGYYADLFRRDWSQSRLYAAQLTAPVEQHASNELASAVVGKFAKGTRVNIIAERPGDWFEVSLGLGKTAFIQGKVLGITEVTAREAQYVVGRQVILTGKVTNVRSSDKVTKIQFGDPERPSFEAVIFPGDLAKMTDAGFAPASLLNKNVKLRGFMKVYTIPEIILSKPTQIEILK